MYTRVHECMHACMYVCTYVCMHICMHVRMFLQTKTGGKLMMRHDRSRGGSMSVASPSITSWSRGIASSLVSHPCLRLLLFSLLFSSTYIYRYRSPPALSDTWCFRHRLDCQCCPTLATNPLSPLPLCDLPYRLLFPLLPTHFTPRTVSFLTSLHFDACDVCLAADTHMYFVSLSLSFFLSVSRSVQFVLSHSYDIWHMTVLLLRTYHWRCNAGYAVTESGMPLTVAVITFKQGCRLMYVCTAQHTAPITDACYLCTRSI